MIPVVHNIVQEEKPQELQGNQLTLVYEKLGVVLPDQLLDIGCGWPILCSPHLAIPHCAPWLQSFLTIARAPSSYHKVSHIPAMPLPAPCPCPCPVHAHTLSMPAPCPCPRPVHSHALSMPTPSLCTSWVSHSQNQVVLGNACIEKNSGNSMWVVLTTCWSMMGHSYCRSVGEPECGGEGQLAASDHKQ